jgi:hypothetical protein
MDSTITFDEVTTLVVANLPSLELRPTFEQIRALCRHFKRALQRLLWAIRQVKTRQRSS